MIWTFDNTAFHTGEFNMRYDERLAREVAEGSRPSTVRVFGWNPPAISLGWNQSLEDIDIEAAARDRIEVVRRPTGGRAILHSDELTYSVVMPAHGKSVSTVYREISRALVCGLRRLGVDAVFEKSQPHFPTLYQSPAGVACFSSSARYEIKVRGQKLVGSAQRRYFYSGREVVLQHGSILLGPDHLRIPDFLSQKSEERRMMLKQELAEKTTDLKTVLGLPIRFDDVADVVRKGFEESWRIVFESVLQPHHHTVLQS